MALLERRIGLLFAAFLVLLLLAGRARALPGHRQGLEPAPAPPPPSRSARCELPARRGTIVDRHGVELAVSEPADDVSATPVPGQGPGQDAPRKLAPLLGVDPDDARCASSPSATPASSTSRARCPAGQADGGAASSNLAGIELTPGAPARLPARVPRRAAARLGRHRRRRACAGSSTRDDKLLHGHRRRAPPRQGRARRADLDPRHRSPPSPARASS